MTKPTLLVLAAGMGSRYGSLKQMDGVGPDNEAIIDYSIYDAIRAGFGKVVFVIRHDFENEFREVFSAERFGGRIDVDYVFQDLDKLPAGFSVPEGRVKPWGTTQAVLMAADAVKTPFAVINADDFYGQDAYATIAGYLHNVAGESDKYAMVGYRIENTLSDFGSVSRGVCSVDSAGNLESVVERTSIERKGGRIMYADGCSEYELAEGTPVSMNLFGFTLDIFDHAQKYFKDFLAVSGGELKSECYIPSLVNKLISNGTSRMRVLDTDAQWFGVTYKEDRPMVVAKIQGLIDSGAYPAKLWK